MDRNYLRKWLKAGFIEKAVFNRRKTASPRVARFRLSWRNFTLDGLETLLRENSSHRRSDRVIDEGEPGPVGGRLYHHREPRGGFRDEVKPLVEAYLRERGLELSPEKTRITPIETGFDFLGQHVRRYNDGKTIVKPSVKNKKAFLMKVR